MNEPTKADRRGALSKILWELPPGGTHVLNLDTWQQYPHQSAYYYNTVAKKEGKPHRFAARRDIVGRWYIERTDKPEEAS